MPVPRPLAQAYPGFDYDNILQEHQDRHRLGGAVPYSASLTTIPGYHQWQVQDHQWTPSESDLLRIDMVCSKTRDAVMLRAAATHHADWVAIVRASLRRIYGTMERIRLSSAYLAEERHVNPLHPQHPLHDAFQQAFADVQHLRVMFAGQTHHEHFTNEASSDLGLMQYWDGRIAAFIKQVEDDNGSLSRDIEEDQGLAQLVIWDGLERFALAFVEDAHQTNPRPQGYEYRKLQAGMGGVGGFHVLHQPQVKPDPAGQYYKQEPGSQGPRVKQEPHW